VPGDFGPAKVPIEAVVGEHRLDDIALEPAAEIVVDALRHQIDDAVHLAGDVAVAPQEQAVSLNVFQSRREGSTGVS